MNKVSDCFLVYLDDKLCGFFSLLVVVGFKGYKNFHRVVILPEFQGLGLSKIVMDILAKEYSSNGFRIGIVTSAPAMIHSLNNNEKWILRFKGRGSNHTMNHLNKSNNNKHRLKCSFKYVGET